MINNGTPGDAIAKRTMRLCAMEPKAVHYTYNGGVTINKGETIPFNYIVSLDVHRDFVNNFSDVTIIEVIINTRDYYDKVLTNPDVLEVYIRKRQMGENSMTIIPGGLLQMRRYKAIPYNPPRRGLGSGGNSNNEITEPELGYTKCFFQLIDYAALDMKTYQFTGLFPATKPHELLAMAYSGTTEGMTLDSVSVVAGVHMANPDYTTSRDIIVPRGTTMNNIAQYIQQTYGIYNFGIGAYLFDQHWYVYPLFNNARFEREHFKLVVSIIPYRSDPTNNVRTYYVDDGILTIINNEKTNMLDNRSSEQLNSGTGIQVKNTSEARSENVNYIGPSKWLMTAAPAVSTFNAVERKDGYRNYVPILHDENNMAKHISSVAGNEGTYLNITWKYANPDLLQPGMPVKIAYGDTELKHMYGTLHEYHAISQRSTSSIEPDIPYICHVVMRVYVTDKQTRPIG
nr:MAG TPA: hypothetical protein [Caudoviricetes sp.]